MRNVNEYNFIGKRMIRISAISAFFILGHFATESKINTSKSETFY